MVGDEEHIEDMAKGEPRISLSEKMLKDGQFDGFDVEKSVKRLIEKCKLEFPLCCEITCRDEITSCADI